MPCKYVYSNTDHTFVCDKERKIDTLQAEEVAQLLIGGNLLHGYKIHESSK